MKIDRNKWGRKDEDKQIISNYKPEAKQEQYENKFKLLSKLLTKIYNQKCIVLIDEYDTPIQTGFIKGYYNEIVDFV